MDNSQELDIFNRLTLSPQEEKDGKQFNAFQRAMLHNLRADLAQSKLNLTFTPESVINYAQQEACLTGQIDLLNTLLTATPTEITEEN